METTPRYFLKKTDKLKSRKAIEMLFAKGNSFTLFPFRVLWKFEENEVGLKAGFSASTKNFKKAVDRNKIKRLLKESYRLQRNELSNLLLWKEKGVHIFFIYTGKDIPGYELLYTKTTAVLNKIAKLANENFK